MHNHAQPGRWPLGSELVVLAFSGSTLGPAVADAAARRGEACRILDLDAPLKGRGVTLFEDRILWEGFDLLQARAILVERPVFSWPQPSLAGEEGRADREARALAQSVILAVGERRPVINPPAAAFLAHSPAIALDKLTHAGFPVVPWRLGPAPEMARRPGTLVLDAAGRDRWHAPSVPPPGQPALTIDPAPDETWMVLVAGGKAVAAEHSIEDRKIPAGIRAAYRDSIEIPSPVAELAVQATSHLHLVLASVVVAAPIDSPAVVLVEAGPDLDWWHGILGGSLASSLLDCLLEAAS